MERFGQHGRIIYRHGKKEELVAHLLEGATLMAAADRCELFVVSTTSPDEPPHFEAIWVTEIWRSKADYDAMLKTAEFQDWRERGEHLIDMLPTAVRLVPRGGKGLTAH
jgi:quinol monooxygenase YgiN